jgi:hypothetical protein
MRSCHVAKKNAKTKKKLAVTNLSLSEGWEEAVEKVEEAKDQTPV